LPARLYQPEGEGPFPAIVDVHGGAWSSFDRLQNASIDAMLAATGIVVLALEFRMPPAAIYPAPVAEINFGIRWLKAHAQEYRTRADLVGGLGTSSGGHQLMLSALRPGDPRYSAIPLPATPPIDARLSYVVLGWPVLDPLARYAMARERGIDRLVAAHQAYWPSEDAMAEGNPQLILERGEAEQLPPVLVIQGTDDENLPADMADRFAAAYRTAGGTVRLEWFSGQPHTFVTKYPDSVAARRARESIAAFIHEQHAYAKGAPV
jgi:acetyl esterase/lipase